MAFSMTGTGSAQGYILYRYLIDEVPNFFYNLSIPSYVSVNDVKADPIFLSPNRAIAKQWKFFSGAQAPVAVSLPVEYGQYDYIMMTTPLGVVYAFGLGDDGNFYTQQFENGLPVNRQVVSTVMHKGSLVFVADNRQPMPKLGDW